MEDQTLIAQVQAVQADGVWLDLPRASACHSCRTPCLPTGQQRYYVADNPLQLQVGEQVVVRVLAQPYLAAAGKVYVLPMLALLLGIALGYGLKLGEGGSVVLGLGALFASLAWIARSRSAELAPVQIHILQRAPQSGDVNASIG